MKQSRLASFTESAINIAVGFAISFGAQLLFLPMLGVPILLWQNTAFAIIMTVISFGRSYLLRRIFEFFQIRIPLSPGALAIIAERRRQQEVEGYLPEYDLKLHRGDMARAGAAYFLLSGAMPATALDVWPWNKDDLKPKEFRRNIVRGCALGLAELDRMDAERKRGKA
jgi:hypothetical protein